MKVLQESLIYQSDDAERLRQAMPIKKKDEVYQIANRSGNKEMANELAELVDAYGRMEIITEYEERWKDQSMSLLHASTYKKGWHPLLKNQEVKIFLSIWQSEKSSLLFWNYVSRIFEKIRRCMLFRGTI